VLIEQGFVTEDQICEGLAKQFGIPYINLKYANVSPAVARKLPEMYARRHRALVLEERENSCLVGMSDPSDLVAYDEIARILKRDIDLAVVNESLLLQTLDRVYRRTEEITGLARALEQDIGDSVIDLNTLSASASVEDAPVVRLLQTLFEERHAGRGLRHPHRAAGAPAARALPHRRHAGTALRPTPRSPRRWCCA